VKIGSMFTGCGGIELGLKLAGVDFTMDWWAEINEDLSVIRLPGTDYDVNLGDVTTVDWTEQEQVDMITAGFPCQPFSSAGGKRGDSDPRWMWPEVAAAVADLQPQYLLVENVPNLIYFDRGRLWNQILADLDDRKYGVRWLTLGACSVGCAHHRHRLFFLATRGDKGVVRVPTRFCGVQGRWDVFPTPTSSSQGWDSTDDPMRENLHMLAINSRSTNRYARAVATQAGLYGPPPPISELSPTGIPRLSAKFSEWLMCLPPGHVTDRLPRTKALEVIGNAVCPPQLAEAWRLLKPSDDLGQDPEREAGSH
jgi:DNA (cytosine-5)-methyltransferase 1